jgi:cobalamin biosynthesis protein CobT
MAMTTGVNVAIFDRTLVNRMDAIRFRRAGDTTFRNGIITKVSDSQIEILGANIQNQATSFTQINAVDVAVGVWEIYWTTDFITVNYQPGAGSTGP